jgi:uncharacterized protein (TIGR02145 family)
MGVKQLKINTMNRVKFLKNARESATPACSFQCSKTKWVRITSALIAVMVGCVVCPVYPQAPGKMSYQAVVRNAGNNIVSEQLIGIRISILQGSVSGSVVYSETQTPVTNVNGLISIEIGGNSEFDSIRWERGPYFIQTEIDPEGGTSYSITGVSQLLSVPYALHAKSAESITNLPEPTNPKAPVTKEYLDKILKKAGILPENYSGTITGIDGSVYKTVTIGSQTWMAENLRTTKLNDQTGISLVTDNSAWEKSTTPAYCWYDNAEVNSYKASTYGALYNWYAVSTGNICPIGWHVPTRDEWSALMEYLGGYETAVNKLKETGTTHWLSANNNATNETGFSALPGGFRLGDGSFADIGYIGYWWSATDFYKTHYAFRWSVYESNMMGSNLSKTTGRSVRCVKDIDIPADGLVCWYPLNGNANDSSKNRLHGKVYGATATSDRLGNFGGAMLFNESGNCMVLPANSLLGETLTIGAWVKVNSVKNWARIIEFGNSRNTNTIAATLSTDSACNPALVVCSALGCKSVAMPAVLSSNTWYHVAFTIGSDTVNGYINGIRVLTEPLANKLKVELRQVNYIGRSSSPESEFASAVYDNIRVYNRVLSHEEIIALAGEK